MRAWLLLGLMVAAGPLLAEPVKRSLLPLPNPIFAASPTAAAPAEVVAAPVKGSVSSLRPMPRPRDLDRRFAAARDGKPGDEGLDLMNLRDNDTELASAEPAPKKKKKKDKAAKSKKGSVCGVAAIKGDVIAPIKSKVKGCGLPDGVRVTSVSGVSLSQAITVDCATATALNTWVDGVVQPAYGNKVVELKIAAHYICRTRNNKKGAKISEHGRGKAVDVAGFLLDSGKVVTVVSNYNKTMRKVHKAACGIFGTTLGPGSDGYHEDHIHLDTAGYRGGPYCR